MKRFVLFLLLLDFLKANAATYYSRGSFDPGILSNWGNSTSGGTSPTAFNIPGDIFIIQGGHTMQTTSTWTFGTPSSTLRIDPSGILIGKHLIQFQGTFRLENGGRYVHQDYTNIGSNPGNSIWGGTESFAPNSYVEIQDWLDTNPLPAGISWGNLVINVTSSLNGTYWSQEGNLTTIQGNLQIVATDLAPNEFEFRFTTNTSTTVTIGGNLYVDGGILNVKGGTSPGVSCSVQVNGSIIVSGGTLNTGSADVVTHADLNFKGNFSANGGTITSTNDNAYLVANGTLAQSFTCVPSLGCPFKVANGATVNLTFSLTTSGATKIFSIQGTFNKNGLPMTMQGPVEVAGGVFNSIGPLTIGVGCRACTGDGTFDSGNGTWCTLSGTQGTANFIGSNVSLNLAVSTTFLSAGHLTVASPGNVYFYNSTATTINTPSANNASYVVRPNSIFSLDATSYISGVQASWLGQGGTLRIGSIDGIAASANTGNVRTPTRTYTSSGNNGFEYFGSNPQITGTGLPTTITGTLKINNSSALSTLGVTLTNSTTVDGFLDLTAGKLRTSAAQLLSISAIGNISNYSSSSFVGGPLKVTGHSGFTFPVGINAASPPTGTIYAPIVMNYFFGTTLPTESYTAEYIRGNPQTTLSSNVEAPIDHISFVEYWSFQRTDAGTNTPTKQIVLEVNPESICYNLNTLLVARYDGVQWKNLGQASNILVGFSPPLVWGKLFSNTTTNVSGYYTLATTDAYADNPLPIKLISFDAVKLSTSKAVINWELGATCSSATRFEIQRSLSDRNFSTIGIANGSETSRTYTYIDNGLKNGINYYRLKIIDADGKISYSKVVALMNGVNGLILTSFAPTIVIDKAYLSILSSDDQKIDVIITDMQGRVASRQNYHLIAGNSNIEISTGRLSAGIYQVVAIGANGRTNATRFIKN